MTGSETPTAAEAFEVVWNTLVGVLGTGATATMLRRAGRSAAKSRPGLEGFRIIREELEYKFVLPPAWNLRGEEALAALRYLVREELCPLLEELTGPVIIRLLERQPGLQRHGIVAPRGEQG